MGESNSFTLSVCPQGEGVSKVPNPPPAKVPTPRPGQNGWKGYPKVPTPPPQSGQDGVRGYLKVPTPRARSGQRDGERGYCKVPTPQPRYLPPPLARSGRGEGVPQGTYPLPRPPGQGLLLHGGRYASCVHAGGLSCVDY